MTSGLRVDLPELHNPDSGRLDAQRIANYLSVPLAKLARAIKKNYQSLYKTPDAPGVQQALFSIKHSLDILSDRRPGDRPRMAEQSPPGPGRADATPSDPGRPWRRRRVNARRCDGRDADVMLPEARLSRSGPADQNEMGRGSHLGAASIRSTLLPIRPPLSLRATACSSYRVALHSLCDLRPRSR